MNILNKKGFSFVEILVVVLLSTVIFAGIYSTFIVGNNAWVYYNDSVAVKKEVRRALFGMVKELREAENIKIIHSSTGVALHFYRQEIGAISYVWNSKGKNANRLMRYGRSGMRIMAQYISGLSFQHTKNTIFINISASKETSKSEIAHVELKERVTLRSELPVFQ